ncbi:LysR family transcriptional regulator [Nocardiopsis mangrovi]|uniref:LysR family transcriptional regulator n=1 Tax=Nocardiopsis mangrovi TaxID=1179818 RepID=A0ABV9DVL6_9ACTN
MSGPSLQRLRVFVAVAETGGFSAAARALEMAQSSVSTHLRHLEAEIGGTRLFDRTAGAVTLTLAGETLLGYARRVLATYAEAVDSLRRLGHGPVRGTLSIGGTATAGEGVLPRLLVAYAQRHPQVDLDLRIDNTTETLRLLDTGKVGLALVAGPRAGPDSVLVAEEPQAVIAAADHPLAGVAAVDPEVLRASTVLVREPGSTTREYQLELLGQWGIPSARVWTVSSTAAIVHAVAAGLGIACVTRGAADTVLRLGRVAELNLDPAPATRPVHLALRRGRSLSGPEQAFVALAREGTAC